MIGSMHDTVGATFLEVVEQLTFMFGEPAAKDELDIEDAPFVTARLAYTGDRCGELHLIVEASLLGELAANILGVEPDELSDAVARDALGELLNVVSGHVIMEVAGSGSDFKLGRPRVEPVAAETMAALVDDDDYLGFLLDDRPVYLGLTTEG